MSHQERIKECTTNKTSKFCLIYITFQNKLYKSNAKFNEVTTFSRTNEYLSIYLSTVENTLNFENMEFVQQLNSYISISMSIKLRRQNTIRYFILTKYTYIYLI